MVIYREVEIRIFTQGGGQNLIVYGWGIYRDPVIIKAAEVHYGLGKTGKKQGQGKLLFFYWLNWWLLNSFCPTVYINYLFTGYILMPKLDSLAEPINLNQFPFYDDI